jgi:hypothetical protein
LQEIFSVGVIEAEISSRNNRVLVLQKRWERLLEGLDKLLDERGADMADIQGGQTGLLCRE